MGRGDDAAGVNAELMPLVRMTFPASVTELSADDVVMGETVCHCWVLAGGFIPFDRHALGFESISDTPEAGRSGFVEESTSWMQKRWRHERTVVAIDKESCEVTDRVTVEPRVPFIGPIVQRIVGWVFTHRHRRLVRHWGAA